MVMVPVSWGEVIDKISILEIKREHLSDSAQLENVRREYDLLVAIRERDFPHHRELATLSAALKDVNARLWTIEDDIRDQERTRTFGARFIELARAVYKTNDERARLKRQINDLLGSELVEEKSYAPY